MTLEVIGAGYGRTGTLSLKHALEKLGFDKCYHGTSTMNRTIRLAHTRRARACR